MELTVKNLRRIVPNVIEISTACDSEENVMVAACRTDYGDVVLATRDNERSWHITFNLTRKESYPMLRDFPVHHQYVVSDFDMIY
jgi:hypothetical protein